MSDRRDRREPDETPPRPWREMSSPGIRSMALQQAAEAVHKAKEKGGRR